MIEVCVCLSELN